MIVNVPRLPASGLKITKTLPAEELGLEVSLYRWDGPIHVDAKIFRVEDAVIAEVRVSFNLITACARCLKDVVNPRSYNFQLDYSLEDFQEEINLGEDIRQEIVMRLPLKVLCQEDCRGLCAGCGADLNTEKCTCKDAKKRKS